MIMATTHKHSVPAIILLLVCAIHSASLVEATVIASATNQEDGGVIPQDDDGGLNPIGDTAQDIAGVFEPVDSDDSDSSATPGVSDGHSQKEPDLAEETIFYTTQSNHSNSGSASNGSTPLHTPPTHFKIAAHIQSNLHTGYSYFLPTDQLSSSFAHLPFLECGAVGSTTEGNFYWVVFFLRYVLLSFCHSSC